jgi:hypothetical protein
MANPVVLKTLFKNLEDSVTQFHSQTYHIQNEGVINVRELLLYTEFLSKYISRADLTSEQEMFKNLFTNLKVCIAEFYAEHSGLDTDGQINFMEVLQDCDMLADYLAKTS